MKFQAFKWIHRFLLACAISLPGQAAATVVQIDIVIGDQTPQAVYIELLDSEAPATVANFLNYVENTAGERRYDGTFIHRLAENFVIQLGGYIFDPLSGDFGDAGTSHIVVDPPVINEFSADRSNLRGTIAMAKVGNDPDSATSEWFFNLADNSGNLDQQNGGFTVFGRVLGVGMDVIDAIANLQTDNQGDPFSSLPVVNFTPGNPVTNSNLVKVNQIITDPPAAISPDDMNPDFGLVALNAGPVTRGVIIQNIGTTSLSIGNIGNTNSLAAPFSFSNDNCSAQTLAPMQTCTITTAFEPILTGEAQDSFNIPSNAGNFSDLVVTLQATGAPETPVLDAKPVSVTLGTIIIGSTSSLDITIENRGGGLLVPGGFNITGTDASDFDVISNSCSGVSLSITETCNATIQLSGNSVGTKTATLRIDAEPGGQTAQIELSGGVIQAQSKISTTNPIDIGDTETGKEFRSIFSIRNTGIDTLIISSIEVIGSDAPMFALGNFCTIQLPSGTGCGEELIFTPTVSDDVFDASIRIISNDPDNPIIEIPVLVSSSGDGDGIADAIENGAANGGDGNRDGIQDSAQSHVSSLPNINGDYVTIETAANQILKAVRALDNPSPGNSPVTVDGSTLTFSHGFFEFIIENVPAGGSATAVIYFPENGAGNSYLKHGKSPDNPFFDHWYLFNFNGQTGAEFQDGRITLHFIDGGRGDSDLAADGRIVDPGGPATVSLSGPSGSGGSGCALAPAQARLPPVPIDFIVLIAGLLLIHLYPKKIRSPARSSATS